mgnify:FL=1
MSVTGLINTDCNTLLARKLLGEISGAGNWLASLDPILVEKLQNLCAVSKGWEISLFPSVKIEGNLDLLPLLLIIVFRSFQVSLRLPLALSNL